MDDAPGTADGVAQRDSDVRTLLRLVETRGLTADQFHAGCSILFAGQDEARSLSELIAAVVGGTRSMAALIAAVTVPEEYGWTADRVIIWVEDGEARAEVNLREGRSMRVALTKHGLTAERSADGAPVAALRRTYDELLPAPS